MSDLLSAELKVKSQAKLNNLCNKHGIKPWPIEAGSGKARWRDLVLAMCGIPATSPQKRGRKKNGEAIDVKIAHKVIVQQFFIKSEKKKAPLLKATLAKVADELSLDDKLQLNLTPDAVRAGSNRFKKRLKERSAEDWGKLIDKDDLPKLPQPPDIEK